MVIGTLRVAWRRVGRALAGVATVGAVLVAPWSVAIAVADPERAHNPHPRPGCVEALAVWPAQTSTPITPSVVDGGARGIGRTPTRQPFLSAIHALAAAGIAQRSTVPGAAPLAVLDVVMLSAAVLGTAAESEASHGRATATPPVPAVDAGTCRKATDRGLTEVRPGIFVGRDGPTVTVIADRALVELRAVDGPRTHAADVAGDVVVNANWFTDAGSEGPLVSYGVDTGTVDTIERGQILVLDPGCGPSTRRQILDHRWTGELYRPGPCVVHAVSGVSLVHQGRRADAFPGIDLTTGYTNVNRSHSFIGFNDTELIVVASTDLNASELADYALALGASEGVMLDGGGSTQIATPTATIASGRPVPAFAVIDSRA